jgi:putative membrane protein
MFKRITLVLVAVAVALLSSATAGALTQPDLNEQDREFLRKAHRSNLAEIQAGQAAQEKGASATVRDLGAKIVTDHTKLDRDVRRVAEQVGVDLPKRPSADQRRELEQVAAQSGKEFDRAWLAAQIAGHHRSLANGAKELQDGSSSEVKKLARDAKPIVQTHLDMLQQASGG